MFSPNGARQEERQLAEPLARLLRADIYIYIYIHIMYVYIYIYIYVCIQREREREREIERDHIPYIYIILVIMPVCTLCALSYYRVGNRRGGFDCRNQANGWPGHTLLVRRNVPRR